MESTKNTTSDKENPTVLFDFISDFYLNLATFVAGLDSWQQVLMLMVSGAIPFVESYLGSFLGVVVGASPWLAVPAAVVGNSVATFALIALAGRARTAVTGSPRGAAQRDDSKRRRKVATYLDRFGVPGVCLLGPIVVASQITAPTLVGLGASRRSVYLWSGVSIIAWGIAFGFFGEATARFFM